MFKSQPTLSYANIKFYGSCLALGIYYDYLKWWGYQFLPGVMSSKWALEKIYFQYYIFFYGTPGRRTGFQNHFFLVQERIEKITDCR